MRVGIGLPTAVSPPDGRVVVAWARAAEEAGFASVAVIDRLLAPTYDPLTVLAAAAAATMRIELHTAVLLGPLRPVAVLASQAATVDQLSGGRLRLGVGVGNRKADYDAAGVPFERRGRILDEHLAELRRIWAQPDGFTVPGPAPFTAGGPPVLVGGTSDAAVRRAVEFGAGWICGVGGAPAFTRTAELVRKAWRDAGRNGEPTLLSVVNVSLGADAERIRDSYLRGYYGAAPFVEGLVRDSPATPAALRDVLAAHRDAGCDEVLLLPCSAEVAQLDIIAELL